MSNMSYVRFENTLADLQDCYEHLYDKELSTSEDQAKADLISLCNDIVAEIL